MVLKKSTPKNNEEAIEIYKISQKNRLGILDVSEEAGEEKTRRSKYEKISVIPLCYKDAVLAEKPYKRWLYEVKIPLWYYQEHKREYNNIMFCQMEYNDKLGAVI